MINGVFIELLLKMTNSYLQKFGFQPPVIKDPPRPDTGLIVVIPSYDEPNLIQSLEAINRCTLPKDYAVEIITVINSRVDESERVKRRNSESLYLARNWANENQEEGKTFHFIIEENLPRKHAGVGLARKIGMDEAVSRAELLKEEDIPIVCFDADASCDGNYLTAIYEGFKNNPAAKGASIYFEHPISGQEFEPFIYTNIIDYELHLRYYKNALEFTKHPFACYTIGSSMAVMASAYMSQGGMNKRKAGEDFYFMQKIKERFPIIEINETRVIPSPRQSKRVPFGTGRAMWEFAEGKDSDSTYAFDSFKDLKVLNDVLHNFYTKKALNELSSSDIIPASIRSFLKEQQFENRISDLYEYGTTWDSFQKRFYNWFNAFRALKFVHFARDNYYPDIQLVQACDALGAEIGLNKKKSNLNYLNELRAFDRSRKL